MTLALIFGTPLLLVGLLAAAIPWLLHLLSSVRAQEVYFPTLRFLKLSMEKTARRRKIQHWLLLVVRSILLALLCLSVAEPISRSTGGWFSGGSGSAAIVLDNSYSMAARDGGATRLDRARNEAASLLSGDEKPALGALMTTSGGAVSAELSTRMDSLRDGLTHTAVGFGSSALAQRVSAAAEMLDKKSSSSRKAVYIFSDLQRAAFEELLASGQFQRHPDIRFLVIDSSSANVNNVGISGLEISGRRSVDSVLEFSVTLVNSSPMDRVVNVGLRVDGKDVAAKGRLNLAAAGKDGHAGTVTFRHAFARPGSVSGEAYIEQADDLPMDNVRRFALQIGGRVNALVVRGGRNAEDPWWMDGGARILVALEPYVNQNVPNPIVPKVIEADQFSAGDLAGDVNVAFFTNVPSFSPEQSAGIAKFVREGGSAIFFLGPDVIEADYNQRLASGAEPLLPAKLAGAVGEVGVTAGAQSVDWVDVDHPYLRKLWSSPEQYLSRALLVQRHFRLSEVSKSAAVLARLKDGDALVLAQPVGAGQCVLCTTTSSPRWSNLYVHPLFLPMISRMCLLARQGLLRDPVALSGSQVPLRLPPETSADAPAEVEVRVTLPAADPTSPVSVAKVKAKKTSEGYVATFDQTQAPGTYSWSATAGSQEISGVFAINPDGDEANLESISAGEFRKALETRQLTNVCVASTVLEANAMAAEAAEGRNWWDVLVAFAIVFLVVESVIANRRRMQQDIIPAHLNPKVSRQSQGE